jgi:hypothetical protein
MPAGVALSTTLLPDELCWPAPAAPAQRRRRWRDRRPDDLIGKSGREDAKSKEHSGKDDDGTHDSAAVRQVSVRPNHSPNKRRANAKPARTAFGRVGKWTAK